jgi:hypothetical protein
MYIYIYIGNRESSPKESPEEQAVRAVIGWGRLQTLRNTEISICMVGRIIWE